MKDLKDRPAVMLQHGLLDNSATWTINEFNNTLPYLLLQEGYDVWITNTRGNFNSYEHKNPKDFSVFSGKSQYWNFTLDDMAIYDLPANIDYILDYTNNEKITYIGHSQGTIQFFAANCVKNLADKIERFVGLGPVMFVNHVESPIVKVVLSLRIDHLIHWLGLNNILLWPKILNVQLKDVVKPIKRTVWRFIQLICGVGEEFNIELERMPVMGRHEPGGTGMLNMMHWIQLMRSGNFQRFDFGEEENMRVYGQPTAPLYDLEFMKENLKDLDMLLVRGGSDGLVSQPDFDNLLDVLKDKTPETLEHMIVPKYGHLDYVWAKDSLETVNKPVIEFLKKKETSR
jgi:pimeloyl-ACP methyl ester carboxylesterase